MSPGLIASDERKKRGARHLLHDVDVKKTVVDHRAGIGLEAAAVKSTVGDRHQQKRALNDLSIRKRDVHIRCHFVQKRDGYPKAVGHPGWDKRVAFEFYGTLDYVAVKADVQHVDTVALSVANEVKRDGTPIQLPPDVQKSGTVIEIAAKIIARADGNDRVFGSL